MSFDDDARDDQPKRVPVNFRYDALLPNFLLGMAKIGSYASEKYGSWDQYLKARLTGEKSPVNHIYEHLRQYQMGETYDHFDGDLRWHLIAVAYNAMMEWWYHTQFGHSRHPSASGATTSGDGKVVVVGDRTDREGGREARSDTSSSAGDHHSEAT